MNLLLLSLLIIQNVTSYLENFKNGVNTQFVKDNVKYGPGNEVHNLNTLSGGDSRGSTGTPGSYFKSQHAKIDVNKLDSLLNASNYLKPLQHLLKSSESMKMFTSSASQLSPYRLSRKLNDDSSNYDEWEDDESFLETNESDNMSDREEDNEEYDHFDEQDAESFLETDEYDEINDGDNDHDAENDDFSGDHEESFLEKEEYDDASDNENDEFYDEDADSFLEQDEYEDLSDNDNDEFGEHHGESFLEKEDGDEESTEDNGKDFKEEYQNKMNDAEYPDEYVGKDDNTNGSVGTTQSSKENASSENAGNENGSNVKELKNKENESFLEKNVNGQTEEEIEKRSTFVSRYIGNDNMDDNYNDENSDEDSFLEEDSYSYNDDEKSDDTYDDYFEDSFLERGKLGMPYSDYYEEDADEEDTKESNEDVFDNHHLNEMINTNDLHSFIQKDMGYIDEIMNDNVTIKDAVKKGSKKATNQSMSKDNLINEEEFIETESFLDDELNGLMKENMDASKSDAKKATATLRNSEKKKNATSAEGKGSPSKGNAGSSITATNTGNAAKPTTKSKRETSKNQTDLSNEDVFNDELTEEVIADSYQDGGDLEIEAGESPTNSSDDKLLDQGVNEDTLLNDNNMIYNANMVPHKKRELYINPHKHTSSTDNKSSKHHTADVDALDKKLKGHELLELEDGEGKNSVIVETEEVDVDLNGKKSSSSVSFLSSVVFLLIGLLCLTS